MRKASILLGLLLIVLFTSAFSLREWQESVYQQIKAETIKGLKDAFKTDVSIGRTEGIIVGQVLFRDVVVPDFARVKKIYVNYNLATFAYKRDIVPAITKITLIDGDFEVRRNEKSQLNVLDFLPPEDPSAPPPPPFRAKLTFKNCRVNYLDEAGFGKEARSFSEKIEAIKGTVGFHRKDKIYINLSGKIAKKPAPTQLKISGSTNLATGNYIINVAADKLDLKKWGSYAVPLDPFTFTGGETDLAIKLAPPKTFGWPVSLVANFSFHNAGGEFNGYKIAKTSGKLSMVDDDLALTNITAHINEIPVSLNGRFFDFAKQNLDIAAALKEADLKKLVSLFPQTKDLDLQGRGDADFKLKGTISDPSIAGTISVKHAEFYNQEFAGKSTLSFKQKLLKIDVGDLGLYQGKLAGSGQIDFSKELPALSLKISLRNINLFTLAQDTPGIAGSADGELNLSGPLNRLKGGLSASLSKAMLFGQPIDNLGSVFVVKDGDIEIKTLSATSKTASIRSSGMIKRDLTFDLQARAQGIKLSGEGVLGKMETMVDLFEGKVSWKLDEKFLASPLKNLTASGEVSLSNGKIGEQYFELAQGKLTMGEGLIQVENVIFSRKKSVLEASGQTGIGFPTQLKISGKKIDLEDFKILNYILPKEAKNPTGQTDINVEISGEIPKETRLTSLDPLLDLNLSGKVALTNVKFADIHITHAKLNLLWRNRKLSFPSSTLKTVNSDLSFELALENENKIRATGKGIIDFSEFKSFTAKYGRIGGRLGINFILLGEIDNPQVAASFWFNDFQFNSLGFDNIEGDLSFSEHKLTLEEPLSFTKGKDEFEIRGVANLEGLFNNQPEESFLALDLKIIRADLSSTIHLYEKIQNEVARKLYFAPGGKKAKIDLSTFLLPDIQQFFEQKNIKFYSANGIKEYFLKTWKEDAKAVEQGVVAIPQKNLGGKLEGKVSIRGKVKKLSGEFEGEIKKGFFRNYSFDNFKAKASLGDEKIRIEKLELYKKRGKITTQGEIGFDGNLLLEMTANNMPLDILQIFFDKNFKGAFNMIASVRGPIQDPTISASIAGKNLTLADIRFDRISLAATQKSGSIFIHDFSLVEGRNLSGISGSFDLSAQGGISLEANLRDNALGLFNLFTNEVKWKKGKTFAALKIAGTTDKPQINGKIFLKKSVIYVRAIDSDIKDIEGEAKIENNLLNIKDLTGIWKGEKTRDYPNFLGIAGRIDLQHIFSQKKMVSLNLALTPTQLYADLPDLYTGVIKVEEAGLSGPFYFDLSEGPTFSGKVEANNAVITLARQKPGQGRAFPLNLDLALALKKNAYAVMGDITTLDLSNIFMNLEIRSDELKVSGDLAHPSLLGKIFLRRGTVTIFNREFSLLNPDSQEKYYPFQSEKIKENVALFTGEKGREGIMPDVTITAKVEVENVEEDEEGVITRENVIILSRLQGVIGALEKEHGLKTSFESFIEDKTKSPHELKPAGYSEQAIKVMLLPDFIKSLTGISKEEEVEANLVVADYISSRVQTFVFRRIERGLEQRLGLESLILEYNFGKDVRHAMGVTERRMLEGERPDWRVGFVKGFFDKFYLDVNYAQFGTETEIAQETFNYQLTYKLSPIWSIIYYHEPISLQEGVSGYEKYTLKAGFSFW